MDETVRRIDELYVDESATWKRDLAGVFSSLKNGVADTFADRGQLVQAIESAPAWNVTGSGSRQLVKVILSVFQRLPAWQKAAVLGSGVLAVGGPLGGSLLMAGSLVSPTFLGGVCTTLGVSTATLLGVLGAKRLLCYGDEKQPEPEAENLCLDDLVRSGIVRTVILELQGRSPEEITSCLESILGNCQACPITTSEQARELCDCAAGLLALNSSVQALVSC